MIENFKRVWLESMPSFCIYMLLSMLFAPVFDGPGGRQSLFHSVMALIFCALWGIQLLYREALLLYISFVNQRGKKQLRELVNKMLNKAGQKILGYDQVRFCISKEDNKVKDISIYIVKEGSEPEKLVLDEEDVQAFCDKANSKPEREDAMVLRMQKSYQYSAKLEVWLLFLGVVNLVYILFRE